MPKNITLSIKWDPDWQEFSVPYYEDGKYKEGPTYYASDLYDAQDHLNAMVKSLRREGIAVQVRENRYTKGWEDLWSKPALTEGGYEMLDSLVPSIRSGQTLHKMIKGLPKENK